ncbi:Spindle and kinetochore-associated protein 1 [Dillenia turbinata]|uniref:SKA complex subunit 1 homolog n=1 Tax=Dillenia turbinata TaxID=194707 RepID=A0AAN8Z0T2_9MAGN
METKQAGTSLDSMISSFNTRILELQQLVIARNMYPANSVIELSAIDTAVSALERQVQAIKDRLHEETEAIPKAKKLIEASLRQQKKIQKMSSYVPSHVPQTGLIPENPEQILGLASLNVEEPPAAPLPIKEKKGRASPPLWYITADELDSLSSYMRGRLTLEKINMAINDMASYAEANTQLISAPKKRLAEDLWEKALVLRDIAMAEAVKGKHFFLETDIKGPALKLDNTGKAILTVLRHLGRISESRIGHHRVFILLRPQ